MANPAVFQSTFVTIASAAQAVKAYGSNNAAGNCLLMWAAATGGPAAGAVTGVTDSNGNNAKWVLVGTNHEVGNNTYVGTLWMAPNCNGGANTVTVNFAGATFATVDILEISGVVTSNPVSASNFTAVSVATTTPTTGSVSAPTGSLILGFCASDSGTPTAGSPPAYVIVLGNTVGAVEQFLSTGGSVTASFVQASAVAVVGVAILTQQSSGGGSNGGGFFCMLGIQDINF